MIGRPRVAACAIALASLSLASHASARDDDGAYGRLDGDVTLVAGLGGGLIAGPSRGFASAEVRARYFDAAGVALAYEESDALSRATTSGASRRALIGAIELRPLFPVRFLRHMEVGRSVGNLVLDSIGLDLGAVSSMREGNGVRRLGLLFGLGCELPLSGEANGVWLRVSTSVRWSAERLEGDSSDDSGRTVVFGIGLAWHEVIGAHVVDAGDRRVE